jgi:hypothetical protein
LIFVLLLGLMFAFCIGAPAQAQRGGGPGGGRFGGFRGGFGGMGGGPLEVARRSDVQKELALTESQVDQIQALAEATRDQARQRFEGFRDQQDPEARRDALSQMRETMTKQNEEARQKLNEILNPNQRSRFAELEFQFNLQRGSVLGALASAGIKISEAEQEKLRDQERDVQEEVRKKMDQLRQEANVELLGSVLDRSKIEQLSGAAFTFEQDAGPGGFGRPGGPPEARGDRPGGQSDDQPNPGRRRRRPAAES